MNAIKTLLTKLFPQYDTGTAAFISAALLSAVMLVCIFANDIRTQDVTTGEIEFDAGAVLVFLGAAGGTYVFGKTKQL